MKYFIDLHSPKAKVVELVDTSDSKSDARKGVWVRVPPLVQKALYLFKIKIRCFFYTLNLKGENYYFLKNIKYILSFLF